MYKYYHLTLINITTNMKTVYMLLACLLFCASTGAVMAQNTSTNCMTGNAVPQNIIYKVNGKVVSTLTGNVKEGNFVEVTFTTSATSTKTRFSLVSYNTLAGTYSETNAEKNEVYDYESDEFAPGIHTMSVSVPNNYFEVDFVIGCVLWKFGPAGTNNYYDKQNRLVNRDNGGTMNCCTKCNHNKPVTICLVPKGNPLNQKTITISKGAAQNRISRNPGSYYGACKPLTDTTSTVDVSVNCSAVTVSSKIKKIKFITLLLDDSSTQTFDINAKTASVSPNNEYEGYFIRGAYVKVALDGAGPNGTFYVNENFADCEEPINPGLPVDLVKFEAIKLEPSVVKLEWATASENNNEYIAIEKSSDIESWKEVCRVPSAALNGNSQKLNNYTCTDMHADEDGQNIVYYRPKQVDLNGTFEYHNTIKIRLQDAAYTTEIQSVYPNPATDRLNIRYDASENGTMNIRLISLDGKAMLQSQFVSKQGVQNLDLDLMEDKLKPGLYVLEVQSDSGIFRQKVYKQ